jgi:hypothetical protein
VPANILHGSSTRDSRAASDEYGSRQVVDSVPATRAARFITPSHAGDVPNAPAAAPLLSIDDVLPRSACTDRSFHEHCEDVG